MFALKIKYELARERAVELLRKGRMKEYIEQLSYISTLKRQLITLSN